MCFHIHRNHFRAKVAEKDIRVYKLLCYYNERFHSPFCYFPYIPKKNYKSKIVKILGGYIANGLHFYSSLEWAKYNVSGIGRKNVICEFIIPKGSEYYYNPDTKEYVSNQTYWPGRIYRTDRWVEFKGKVTDKMIYS